MNSPRICMILAMTTDYLLGSDNALPWHLPADMQWFKQHTANKVIVMGRKTYLSIGKALPGRRTIVMSRDPTFSVADADIAHSKEEVLSLAGEVADILICGGREIYLEWLSDVTCCYLTTIHTTDLPGTTYFPELAQVEWADEYRIEKKADAKSAYDLTFSILRK